MSGATEGKRLGTAGYSYDFVARLFAPLLERLGKLAEVKRPDAEYAGPDRQRPGRKIGSRSSSVFAPFKTPS